MGLCTTPGWTSAIVTFRLTGAAAVSANATGPAATATTAPAAPISRTGIRRAVTTIRMPVLATTSAKLTSHTPPTAARARITGCCHWLAP